MLLFSVFSTARIGHTGMKADEIVDNIIAAAKVIDKKLPKVLLIDCIKLWTNLALALLFLNYVFLLLLLFQNWKNVKVLHLKTLKSVALPIFTARISNLNELDRQPVVDRKEGEVKKNKNLQTCCKTKSEPLALWHLFMCYSN